MQYGNVFFDSRLCDGTIRGISTCVCVAYITICGPDEEQSGFVALTVWVESIRKCKKFQFIAKHIMSIKH